MAISWVAGELNELPVKWLTVKGTAKVNQEKEFLTAKFLIKLIQSNGMDAYFDNFALTKNLLNDKTLGNSIIYLPLLAGTTEYPVFGALADCHIVAAHIVPKADITGTDESPMQLLLRNVDTNEVICTKTFILGNNATANQVTSFGPVNDTNKELYPGNGVTFEQSGGCSIPDILLIIEWNLS